MAVLNRLVPAQCHCCQHSSLVASWSDVNSLAWSRAEGTVVGLSFLEEARSPSEVGNEGIGCNGGVLSIFNIWAKRNNSDLVDGWVKAPIYLLLFCSYLIRCSAVVSKWSSIEAIGIGIFSWIKCAVLVCRVAWVSGIYTVIYIGHIHCYMCLAYTLLYNDSVGRLD